MWDARRFPIRPAALGALLIALATPLAADPGSGSEEVLTYRWHLGGFAGTLARVFVPGKGEGRLSTGTAASGNFESVLHITSAGAGEDEFWTYGALIEGDRPVSVWNNYRFRGREKRRESEIEEPDVIDIPSGIYLLRTDPPSAPRQLRLWTDGKIYPVVVQPGERVSRKVGGRRTELIHYTIAGIRVPGERRWKGELELWVTPDEQAIPVEIQFRKSHGKVHLRLDEGD